MLADRLLIIIISPALAFIITLTGVDGLISYFLTPYTQAYFILIMILLRMAVVARTNGDKLLIETPKVEDRSGVKKFPFFNRFLSTLSVSISKQIWKVLFFLLLFCLIEFVHVLMGRPGFEGLTDIRMLFYSPFYGSIIVFSLYCIYLLMSNDGVTLFHIQFTLRMITYFSAFFIVYWMSLYFGFIPEVKGSNYQNANGLSYYALFACFIMLVKTDRMHVKHLRFYFMINFAVILLNTTRGALLVLALIFIYQYFIAYKIKPSTMLFVVTPVLLLGLTLAVDVELFLGETFFVLFNYVSLSSLEELSVAGGNYISSLGDSRLGDDGSISSVSRIFVNYFAFLNLVNNPLIGVGQTESYMLDVFGAGIHSFQFMLVSSVGLLGIITFVCLINSIYITSDSKRSKFILNGFMFSVLIFTNTIPIYFSLVPFMVLIIYSKKNRWR